MGRATGSASGRLLGRLIWLGCLACFALARLSWSCLASKPHKGGGASRRLHKGGRRFAPPRFVDSLVRLAGGRGKAKQGRLQGKTNSAEPRQSKPGSRAKSAGPKVGLRPPRWLGQGPIGSLYAPIGSPQGPIWAPNINWGPKLGPQLIIGPLGPLFIYLGAPGAHIYLFLGPLGAPIIYLWALRALVGP